MKTQNLKHKNKQQEIWEQKNGAVGSLDLAGTKKINNIFANIRVKDSTKNKLRKISCKTHSLSHSPSNNLNHLVYPLFINIYMKQSHPYFLLRRRTNIKILSKLLMQKPLFFKNTVVKVSSNRF